MDGFLMVNNLSLKNMERFNKLSINKILARS